MNFHWDISLGNIVEFIGLVFGLAGAYWAMRADIRVIKHDQQLTDQKLTTISAALENLSNILVRVAVQDERISGLDRRLEELSHGRGFVK